MKKYLAEGLGTFGLVFFGTGAIVMDAASNGALGNLGIAIAFGLIVTLMIFSFSYVSGAHINPAVSIAFYVDNSLTNKELFGYLIAQFTGAIIASLVLRLLFPTVATLGETMPSGSVAQSFILEFIMTFFLMFVIIQLSTQESSVSKFAAIGIGMTVLLEALVAGPITGASMNPARSLGPALINWNFDHLWIYFVAPILGAITAVGVTKVFKS